MPSDLQYLSKILLEYVKSSSEKPIVVGYLIVKEDHCLEAQALDTPFKDLFIKSIDYINNEKVLHIDTPPPDDSTAKPYEIYSRVIKKGDKDYIEAVLYELQNIYGFLQVKEGKENIE